VLQIRTASHPRPLGRSAPRIPLRAGQRCSTASFYAGFLAAGGVSLKTVPQSC
jgi:hypothetical protein